MCTQNKSIKESHDFFTNKKYNKVIVMNGLNCTRKCLMFYRYKDLIFSFWWLLINYCMSLFIVSVNWRKCKLLTKVDLFFNQRFFFLTIHLN